MTTGVLVMAYGTPRSRDEIEPYYTDIRRGRPPTPEALDDLVRRYEAIGGLSPLAALTEAQAAAVAAALDEIDAGAFRVAIGLKHAHPKIEVTAAELASCDQVIGLVLAPHYSSYSVGQYLDRTRDGLASAGSGATVDGVRSWATEPTFVEFLASDVDARRSALPGHTRVVFTAHSLPERIIDGGDPYPTELRATAVAVAERLGMAEGTDWSIAYQSAGRTPEPWIGPDILETIDDLGANPDVDSVLVCSCGFVADHLEVLYDLDIEAAARAADVGLGFDRTASVNDDPAVMTALAARVAELAGR